MFSCEKCGFLYNVASEVKIGQIGGESEKTLNTLFDKINSHTQIVTDDLKNLKGDMIKYDERFEKMSQKDQRKMISLIKNINRDFFVPTDSDNADTKLKRNNNAFFVCTQCKNNKLILPGTQIYSKDYGLTQEINDYTYSVYDFTLPRTRNYKCRNKKCESHTDPDNSEAVLVKNSKYELTYVCCQCFNHWSNSK